MKSEPLVILLGGVVLLPAILSSFAPVIATLGPNAQLWFGCIATALGIVATAVARSKVTPVAKLEGQNK